MMKKARKALDSTNFYDKILHTKLFVQHLNSQDAERGRRKK
jgi:hypothetical protein